MIQMISRLLWGKKDCTIGRAVDDIEVSATLPPVHKESSPSGHTMVHLAVSSRRSNFGIDADTLDHALSRCSESVGPNGTFCRLSIKRGPVDDDLSYFEWVLPKLCLPVSFQSLTDLRIVCIRLVDVSFLANLPNLLRLVLSGCSLKSVPSEIGCLRRLTELDLTYNFIATVPQEIFWLPALRYLHLGHNCLDEPSLSIKALTYRRISPGREKWTKRASLGESIASGLVEATVKQTPWTTFLCRGLYDPRLFLFIWAFAHEANEFDYFDSGLVYH